MFNLKNNRMALDMFIRPLDRQTVEEIATEFSAFENVAGIKFQTINGINTGSFSALVNDANATLCHVQYGFCVVVAPGVQMPPVALTPPREYLIQLVEVTLDIDIISIRECNSSTGFANEISRFAFDKMNTAGTRTSCTFPILIPRLENKRENLIGVAIMKIGREIKIEFKRDGKVMPALN